MREFTSTIIGTIGLASLLLVSPSVADGVQLQDDAGHVAGQLQNHADELGVAISGISFELVAGDSGRIESGTCTANVSISEPVSADVTADVTVVKLSLSASAGSCGEAGAMLQEGIASHEASGGLGD